MLFNSFQFILWFLPATCLLYHLLHRYGYHTSSLICLLIASLFFYAWWDVNYLLLLLSSIGCNFYLARQLRATKNTTHRRLLLWLGLAANLGALGYFKYTNLVLSTLANMFSSQSSFVEIDIVLPLAISFFTFQQISYLVDCYRENQTKYTLLQYAVFVSFFPQLIAGPIVLHHELIPQLTANHKNLATQRNMAVGLMIFSLGLFKKVIIADSFAQWANFGFDSATTLSLAEAWVTSLSYTFQLYFDFSAYSDMAIGLALLFNIRLPDNFNSPLKAVNIQDFWRRWHITLSRFLRDYVYIPLGGSRNSETNTYINVMITFLLGGLWHGASWTFVFWGFLHGLALCCFRLWQRFGITLQPVLSWLLTFLFVNFAFVFFRAEQWSDAIRVVHGMFGLSRVDVDIFPGVSIAQGHIYTILQQSNLLPEDNSLLALVLVSLAMTIVLATPNLAERASKPLQLGSAIFAAVCFFIALLSLGEPSEFLYFNF